MGLMNKNSGKIRVGIDWIRYSAPFGTNIETILPFGFETIEKITPLPYYNYAAALYPCGRIDTHTTNRKQGMLVTFTGSDLQNEEVNGEYIMSSIAGRDRCKFTRIDVAADLFDFDADPDELVFAYKRGEKKGQVRKIRQIHGYCDETGRDGNTVYLGASRQSETYGRVYQKGLETIEKNKLGGVKATDEEKALVETLRLLDWTRVEIELKGDKAKLAGQAIVEHGAKGIFTGALERYVNFPLVEWWQSMLKALPEAQKGLMKGQNHNQGKSEKWLLTQALPAVEKAIKAGNWQVVERIEKALKEFEQHFEEYDS
jgi:DNA relaxase NicK